MPERKVVISYGGKRDQNVRLFNGDLIIVRENVFMVSSYIVNRDECKDQNAQRYCSFIDLETGSKVFAEPSSRNTTYKRIRHHLDSRFRGLTDEDLEIIRKDDFCINISVK